MAKDISPIDPTDSESARVQKQQQMAQAQEAIAQETAAESFDEWVDTGSFGMAVLLRRAETLEEKRKKTREEQTQKTKESEVVVEKLEEISDEFFKKNPELQPRELLLLRTRLKSKDSPEDILRAVLESYPDHALADEALDFLLETANKEQLDSIRKAKEDLNANFSREVKAGRNMGAEARSYSSQGLGAPSALRDLYREITGNPRDAPILFSELGTKFSFDQLKLVIQFIFHALGADLRAKGPSISRAELHRLMTETRNLQAILWVYRFFRSRMDLINSLFSKAGLMLSSQIHFELLAKLFVEFLMERYPSMDRVLLLAQKLGITDELLAQIILFGQMRDAVRGVAPRLFKSTQHRQDVLLSFIEALENLEEELEKGDEEEEKKEKKPKKDK